MVKSAALDDRLASPCRFDRSTLAGVRLRIDGFGVEQSAQFGLEIAEHAPVLNIIAEVL